MLNKIISFSIRNKLVILLMVAGIVFWGINSFQKLPIDAVPDITNNQVQVITRAPALGATDIERLVTFPIELANSNIPGIKEVRSFSRFGLSLVTLVFNDDVDVYWARQQVAERIQQVKAEIPRGMGEVSIGPVTTGLGEIYQYVIRPLPGYESQFTPTELRTLQDWVVRRQLLSVKGVADVSSFGGHLKQYEVAVNPDKLNAAGITIAEVFQAIEANNQNTGGAYIEKGPTVLYIRTEGLIGTDNDIRNIRIQTTQSGIPLKVGDVAEVRIGSATRYGAMCFNDQGEVSGGIVMMLKGANSAEVIEGVKEKVEVIRKMLPQGVQIEPFLDRTKMVNQAIGTVKTNLIEGALIVVFVLILFLGNFRAGFIVASVIPLSMLFAVGMMQFFGVSGNLMSFGALDFGLIVDGAVIIVEAVLHQLFHNRPNGAIRAFSREQVNHEVEHAAGRMMNSAVFGQIIILIVYLPIFTLEGIEGKMFMPMAQTVSFALLGAFILSLTYVPMMSSLFILSKGRGSFAISDRMMAFLGRHYQRWLTRVLNRPLLTLSVAVGLFAVSIVLLSRMGGEFIPELEEGDFAVETRVLTGSNLQTTIASTQQAAGILKSRFPEVEKVVTKIGSGEIPTDPMPMDAADMMVILKDKSEWTSAATFDELAEKMTTAVSEVPGITVSFQFPVQMRFNELMTGAKQDVVCKIYGENIDTLAYYAQKLGHMAEQIEGAEAIFVEPVGGMPQLVIQYRRNILPLYGLSISELNQIVNMALAGQQAGFVYEGEKRFDLMVRFNQNQRASVSDVEQILVALPSGQQVPLHQLADIQLVDGPNQIQREDARRRIFVGFNVNGRDVESVVQDLGLLVDQNLRLPLGYQITFGGAFENLNAAKDRLKITVPVALLLIFLMLYFSFGSVKQGLLIYSAIPLSAAGGIFALSLRGMPFSISAGVGFIALFGVAVLNGIVLIAEFNRLKQQGETDMHSLIHKGTHSRLRPVLMTAMVASMGFLPMALSNGAGAEVQRPLATVVIGGLLIATFLTLFILPILYMLFESGKSKPQFLRSASLVLLVLASGSISAQNTISRKAAIDSARKNSFVARNAQFETDIQKQLVRSGLNPPATGFSFSTGQINSAYADKSFSVSQNLSFPLVYSRQKSVLKEEWKLAMASQNLKLAQLDREVEELFITALYLSEKRKLLVKTDSLFQEVFKREDEKFKLGETSAAIRSSAMLQRGAVAIQLAETESDLEVVLSRFSWMLNTSNRLIPDPSAWAWNDSLVLQQTSNNHPVQQLADQQIRLAQRQLALNRISRFPDLQFGLNQMSMIGVGADNVLYTNRLQFRSFQFGLGIPLFSGAYQAQVNASKIRQEMANDKAEMVNRELQTLGKSLQLQLAQGRKAFTYFQETAIPEATIITESATRQLLAGEINYPQWAVLIFQAIEVQSKSLDALNRLHMLAVQLHYLNQK